MMPNEQYGRGWVSSLRWETSIQRLQQAKGIQLAIRMGIHTGLVVVGDMGGAGRQEQLALGEVPNIASRDRRTGCAQYAVVSECDLSLDPGLFRVSGIWEHRHSEVLLSLSPCTES